MHRKIPNDVREAFARAYEAGMSSRRLAALYGCSKTTVLARAYEWGLTRPPEFTERGRKRKMNLFDTDEALHIRWQEMLPGMKQAVRIAVQQA